MTHVLTLRVLGVYSFPCLTCRYWWGIALVLIEAIVNYSNTIFSWYLVSKVPLHDIKLLPCHIINDNRRGILLGFGFFIQSMTISPPMYHIGLEILRCWRQYLPTPLPFPVVFHGFIGNCTAKIICSTSARCSIGWHFHFQGKSIFLFLCVLRRGLGD